MRLRHSLSLAFRKKLKCIILIDKRIKHPPLFMANIIQREVFIMDYKRFGNTIYLRLDPKEEILEEIGKVAKKENIRLAQVTGLGAINDFTAGVYNTVTKEYHSIQFQGAFEIVSLTGTVTRKDGDVYLHLHIAAGDEEGHVHGGHLNRAIISATAEIQIQMIDGEIGREFSEEIGLNLFKF